MRVRGWISSMVSLGLGTLASCNGQTLAVGSNELDASVARCDAPWDDDPPPIAPDKEVQRLDTLGVRRWVACPANPPSEAIPRAVDVTRTDLYPLTEQGGVYVRGPAAEQQIMFNLRSGSLGLVLHGVKLTLRLRESPLGMTLDDGAVKFRFTEMP